MGIMMSKIHFENGIPSLTKLQDQFNKQTGLHLNIRANLNLLELPIDNKDIALNLYKDIDKYEELNSNNSNLSKKINHVSGIEFYVHQFYSIDFFIQNNTIEIIYGLGQFYFPTSLIKSLYDLGGKLENDLSDQSKKWKKLKHWNKYKWYNRPRK